MSVTGADIDAAFMNEALALAAGARYRCHPNPQVGCVIVNNGRVVGRGYHERRGGPHAEAIALQSAGPLAAGATVYTTLEPCNHHGSTPPCSEALIAAKVRRVVMAMVDPDPRTDGQGVHRLRAAGIEVTVGSGRAEAEALNRPWLKYQTAHRPYVLLKSAVSLDGKTAAAGGESMWITGPTARHSSHQLRDQTDAILVGINTVIQDNPRLTARPQAPGPLAFGWGLPEAVRNGGAAAEPPPDWRPRQPLRVIVDSMGRTPPSAQILPAVIFVTPVAPPARLQALEAAGAEVIVLAADQDGIVPLPPLLDELARRGVCSLVVEGGAQVNWSFLHHGLADAVRFYLAPTLLGGVATPGLIAGQGFVKLAEAPHLELSSTVRVGEDLMVEGTIIYRQTPIIVHPDPER